MTLHLEELKRVMGYSKWQFKGYILFQIDSKMPAGASEPERIAVG